MKKEYEEINGKKFAIIWRKKGSKITDLCPFCGAKHIHGKSEGHRIIHCAGKIDKKGRVLPVNGFFTKDGVYFDPKEGYILREY